MRTTRPVPTGLPSFARPCLATAVEQHLRQSIAAGHFRSGMPGERALATWYDVSRPVLRRAMARLIAEGLIRQERRTRTIKPVPLRCA